MSKVKVAGFTVSLDGYGAGPNQDLNNPLGVRGTELHGWMLKTEMFQKMLGKPGGTRDLDNEFAEQSMANTGAWIMGRNMFGPIRGPWPNNDWKGWWGPSPPYHVPVYVLSHHAREPLVMEDDTTFYFVTDGIASALKQAKAAAGKKDIRIGGGISTIRQYLEAGAIDEMHVAISPVLLGSGENLLAGLNLHTMGYRCERYAPTADAAHMFLRRG